MFLKGVNSNHYLTAEILRDANTAPETKISVQDDQRHEAPMTQNTTYVSDLNVNWHVFGKKETITVFF